MAVLGGGGTGVVEPVNVKLKKLESGLVVQRFPFGWMVLCFALYHLGVVPGILDLKGLENLGFS